MRAFIVYDPVMTASSGDALSGAGFVEAVQAEAPAARRLPDPQSRRGRGAARRTDRPEARPTWRGRGAALLDARAARRADEGRPSRRRPGGRSPRHGRKAVHRYAAPRIASRNLHGTGCTLSSAIAANVVLGIALPEAVAAAKAFVREAIERGRGLDARRRAPAPDPGEASLKAADFPARFRPCAMLEPVAGGATRAAMTSDFYDSLPIFDEFRRGGEGRELSSAARRLGRRLLRCRRLDRGGRARPLQGGQHGRGRRDRRRRQCARAAAVSRSSSAATARASRSPGPTRRRRPAALAAMAAFAQAEFQLRFAGRDDPGRRDPRGRTRRQGRSFRRDAALRLCDVRRRRAHLVRGGGQARPLCAPARRAGRAARSLRPLLPLGRRAGEARASCCR